MNLEYVLPEDIERRSFEIIESELHGREFPEKIKPVMYRVIHTTADFDYADNLCFSENAVDAALELLKNGAVIVTDTNMAKAGINKTALAKLGCEACASCQTRRPPRRRNSAGLPGRLLRWTARQSSESR